MRLLSRRFSQSTTYAPLMAKALAAFTNPARAASQSTAEQLAESCSRRHRWQGPALRDAVRIAC